MNDYVSLLESELLRAAGERLPVRRRRRRLRTLRTGLAVAASVAVVVTVLVIAVGGHKGADVSTRPRHRATTRGLSPFRARLAVLRRPQTAADRALNAIAERQIPRDSARLLVQETRLVKRLGRRWYAYVVVQVPGRDWPPGPRPAGPLATLEVSPAHGSGGWVFGGTLAGLESPDDVNEFDGYAVALVPDGVARVRWTFRPDPLKPHRHVTPPTRTVTVQNNVAIVRVPAVAQHYVPLGLVRATWYADDGRAIKRYRS